jgi:3-oxoacyl-[acyl-carrier protein] reductase
MPGEDRFPGSRVIVTGGARGIGQAIAQRFVGEGADVCIVDVDEEQATATAATIGAAVVGGDLADAESTVAATAAAIAALGGVDVLVNNAGVFGITPLLDIAADDWDRMFAVNVRSMLLTTQVAARRMIDDRVHGRIVNMASMGGKVGAPCQAHYAASKAAVISLTQVAARELGPHGITVNAICPGFVLTDMGSTTRTPEQVASWEALSPLGRLAVPDDVAAMAMFLASADADYCTGQAINVTGGMIMH